jgi:PIN like domain
LKPRSPTNERLPEPTFFVDENLCGGFAARLRLAGLRVEELREHLPRGTKDTEWLPYVGSRGWVAVTADLFRDDPEEQLALMVHGVPVFVLVGRATQDVRADVFIRKSKWIRRFLSTNTDPFMVRISATTGQHSVTSLEDLLNRYARRRR